ncbi:TPA: alpha/beta fold hydrolase, partial [Pseudomonas aeruginosa]|nr:alpha/beta fold hydrolase [Pseudomonas aeruginosa]
MSSLTWIRGFNGTIGRIAPRWTAERMRRTFMVPGEWPPKDWELPLLASSERVTLRFGLSVLRWGEGPAVLLLHGWAGRPTQFAHLIEQLVGAGYSVYALDAPAHGRSPGREANVVLFAHALLEAAGELPPLRAVVGHSLGGAAALLAAQMGLRSEALVTVSAPSRILEQLRLFARFVGLPALAR